MESSTWEELDVDDSDLPSFIQPKTSTLLPCKRLHTNNSSSHTLEPYSELLPPSQSQLQTLDSPSEQQPLHQVDHHKDQSHPSTSSPRLIPGPAGAIQAAMNRRQAAVTNRNVSYGCGNDRNPNQEYLRMEREDGVEDEDFKRNSWICALDFLQKERVSVDCSDVEGDFVLRSPLSSIKNCLSADRVPQVVAIIESCIPNGLGDLIVTLKDPTGTIGANIHRKVLAESDFGKDISVGSVLILQQVAVFSPSRSARYLNVTLRNMLKVIGKDSGPPSPQTYPVRSTVRCAAAFTGECQENRPGMEGKTSFVRSKAPERPTNEAFRRYTNADDPVEDIRRSKEGSPAPRNFHCSSSSGHQRAAAEVELLLVRRETSKEVEMGAVKRDGNDEERTIDDNDRAAAVKLVDHSNDHGTKRAIEVQNQKQQLISRTSLPQWTDEQLDELFAVSCDDGIFID